MVISDFISKFAELTGDDPREIVLYARRLREAELFPDRTVVRKLTISTADAANLVLAVVAADHPAKAGEALQRYSDLPGATDHPGSRHAPAKVKTKTLGVFLEDVLRRAHSDKTLHDWVSRGAFWVNRQGRAAAFRPDPRDATKDINFRGAISRPGKRREALGWLDGRVLVELSYALADLPIPHHTA
jgi:hypothetical protein